MMLRFYNTKSSMLYNLLRLDEARCFILDELLDKATVQGWSGEDGVRFYTGMVDSRLILERLYMQLCSVYARFICGGKVFCNLL